MSWLGVEPGGPEVEPLLLHLAQQVGLGQRRALVGRHRLGRDEGDAAVEPLEPAAWPPATRRPGRRRSPPRPYPHSPLAPAGGATYMAGIGHKPQISERRDHEHSPGRPPARSHPARMGASGPEEVALADLIGGGKAVIFGLPGAFTGTCTTAHVPSFIRTKDGFAEKGVDEVVCVAVNDPFVTDAWGEVHRRRAEAGIAMVADASGDFTKAIGMDFTSPPAGFYGRSAALCDVCRGRRREGLERRATSRASARSRPARRCWPDLRRAGRDAPALAPLRGRRPATDSTSSAARGPVPTRVRVGNGITMPAASSASFTRRVHVGLEAPGIGVGAPDPHQEIDREVAERG